MLLRDYDWQISYGPRDDRLKAFYIPALERCVQYDRSAGFFSSSALAVAAQGVAALVANGGTMRLLVGAQLSEEDVAAITQGSALEGKVTDRLLSALHNPTDDVMRHRLEVLAWLVADGRLDIRVVLPRDPQTGLPLANVQDYYHPKEGVFTDTDGEQVAFSGSVNESMTAWQRNYEQFSVYFSWDTTKAYLQQVIQRFNRTWDELEPDWIALDIPEAARDALLQYVPAFAPTHDPLAPAPEPLDLKDQSALKREAQLVKERWAFQFLRDAPYLPNAASLGAATSAIQPWPHQVHVAEQVVSTYPNSYLLCDEVGLGKTIEAGLIVRQLLISGGIKRCLILAPRSVARQWQEELYEKFALNIPRYDKGRFADYFNHELRVRPGNPWDAFDVMIATSQLAKRRDRQREITQARPWDLVLVDEAHHARRKDFLNPEYRPNRLLDLLTDPGFQRKATLLMTATPMQVNALEIYDLLVLMGMEGRWSQDANGHIDERGSAFLEFFGSLMHTYDQVDWKFIFEMVGDYLKQGGTFEPNLLRQMRSELGRVVADRVERLPSSTSPDRTIKALTEKDRSYVYELARRHTPLRRYMLRNTRDLLREYVRLGLLNQTVPTREPQTIWVSMRAQETELYHRIEDYITNFYSKYERKRTGLGFIMTVYRRRLTSSFYAVRRSLERRLQFLKSMKHDQIVLLDDDDLEQEELSSDVSETLDVHTDLDSLYKQEVAYIERFLTDLTDLATMDSKTEQLLSELAQLFRERDTVIVFTQYTDTMDYLREALRAVYGSQIACYSGRGGEVWTGTAWQVVTKETIKTDFRKGETIKILLCTEAASEGLNLQTCGILINYDMPYNHMRVEQRIGRIDRIGQTYPVVWIRNYFYEDTIEARVYQALSDRIEWFVGIVGQLQPILAQVGRAIERLVMLSSEEREKEFENTIRDIRDQIDQQPDALGVYDVTETVSAPPRRTVPISLGELETYFISSAHFAERFTPHPDIRNAYLLETSDTQVAVTFNPERFDEHPDTVQFLTYGDQLFQSLLNEVQSPIWDEESSIIRVEESSPHAKIIYQDQSHKPIETFAAFCDVINL